MFNHHATHICYCLTLAYVYLSFTAIITNLQTFANFLLARFILLTVHHVTIYIYYFHIFT